MAAAVQFGDVNCPPRARELSRSEAKALFNATAEMYLRVSGDEFLRRWDDGQYQDESACTTRVMRVAALIPLVRNSARKNAQVRAR
ncbi:MAG: hypothetical protein ACRD2U_15620 [Terriglobales bacterium]